MDHFQEFFLNLPHLKPDKPISSCYTYLLIMYIHTNVVIIIWPFHFLKTSSSPIWHTEFFCCQNFNLSLLFWHQLSSTTSQGVIVHHLFCGLIFTKLVRNHIFDELKILDYGFACHNLFVQIILMRLLIFFKILDMYVSSKIVYYGVGLWCNKKKILNLSSDVLAQVDIHSCIALGKSSSSRDDSFLFRQQSIP